MMDLHSSPMFWEYRFAIFHGWESHISDMLREYTDLPSHDKSQNISSIQTHPVKPWISLDLPNFFNQW